MGKARTLGFDDYVANLDRMGGAWDRAATRSVYVGAGILADEVRKRIEALPVRSAQIVPEGERASGILPLEKKALLDGLGVAKIRTDSGFINTRIGFDGYDYIKTKSFPQGRPVSMIARSVNNGTSWLAQNPFITRSYSSAKKQVESAMEKEFLKELKPNG